jgi:hypothetical protein
VCSSDLVTGSHGKGILLKDKASWEEEKGGLLQVIYEDGVFHNQITLTEIRKKLM